MKVDYLKSLLRNAGDEPDRIQQLRKLIVALAVSGKFGTNKRSHNFPEVSPDELPANFEDPSGFTALSAVARIEKGRTGIKHAIPGAYPLVVTAAERSSCDHVDFEGAAAIVPLVSSTGHGKASLHRLHYQEGKFALGTILAAIFPLDASLVSARFIFEYLSAFKEELLVSRMIGTANVSLSVGKIAEVPIPLVSLDVQAKVDELMALCYQLEATRTECEATRDRLAAASLARLNASDPKTFTANARFALDALPSITTRADQIKQLRWTILNLAVQGRLVEQEPAEESALNVIRRISAIQERLPCTRRKPSRKRPEPSISTLTFPVPAQWQQVPLSKLVRVLNGRAYNRTELLDKGKTKVLRVGNLFTSDHWYFSDLELEPDKYCDPGDLIYAWSASFGPFIWAGPRVIYHYHIWKLDPFSEADICKRFLYLYLQQKTREIKESGHGISMVHMTKEKMEQLAVPLPPLAEQHRIVAKVDELMALCDQLESTLTSANDTRRRLLDAMLAEALQPALQAAA